MCSGRRLSLQIPGVVIRVWRCRGEGGGGGLVEYRPKKDRETTEQWGIGMRRKSI